MSNKKFKYSKKGNNYKKSTKGYSTKGKDCASNIDGAKGSDEVHNDVQWYTSDENLKKLVANISFNTRVGDKNEFVLHTEGEEYNPDVSYRVPYSLPGIMTAFMMPTYGAGKDAQSTIAKASNAVFQYLRSKLKTTASYDPADIMLYLIGIDSAQTWITEMVRALGAMSTIKLDNNYTPRALVTAMGYDYDDIRMNYRDYVTRLNFVIVDLMSRFTPNLFRFQKRHRYLFGNVFTDTPESYTQFYVPVLEYIWFPNYDEEIGLNMQLEPTHGTGITTMSAALSRLEDLVSFLMDNSDFNKISSDLLNAYGPEASIALGTLPEAFMLNPVYSADFNIQLHNSYAVGTPNYAGTEHPDTIPKCAIWQLIQETPYGVEGYVSTRYITADYMITPPFTGRSYRTILDMPDTWSGDSDAVLESTRLLPGSCSTMTYSPDSGVTFTYYSDWDNAPSELVTHYGIVRYSTSNELETYSFTNVVGAEEFDINTLKILSDAETFAYHPTMYYIDYDSNRLVPFQNLRKYAVPDAETIDNIHRYCILGEFNLDKLISGGTMK